MSAQVALLVSSVREIESEVSWLAERARNRELRDEPLESSESPAGEPIELELRPEETSGVSTVESSVNDEGENEECGANESQKPAGHVEHEGLALLEKWNTPSDEIDNSMTRVFSSMAEWVKRRGENICSLLIPAAREGFEECCQVLLEAPATDVNQMDRSRRTALREAVKHGHENVTKLLLQRRELDVNLKDKFGFTPPHVASFGGRSGIVKRLLEEEKTDTNARTFCDDCTPLFLASERGHADTVKILLQNRDKCQSRWSVWFHFSSTSLV